MLGSVSPQMFEEYEVEYVKPLLEQFGLVYYGCCEPLPNRIDYIRKIKNVRKISMSPWADIRAVSYTHLDVYKRQTLDIPAFRT